MSLTLKTIGGKFYVETEEEITIADVLDEIGPESILNNIEDDDIFEHLGVDKIKRYCIENILLDAEESIRACYEVNEIRIELAKHYINE